jgi:hypothetical protein
LPEYGGPAYKALRGATQVPQNNRAVGCPMAHRVLLGVNRFSQQTVRRDLAYLVDPTPSSRLTLGVHILVISLGDLASCCPVSFHLSVEY